MQKGEGGGGEGEGEREKGRERNVKRAFQYVTHYDSANQEFADASVRRYEQKGVLRAGVPSPSPQSPSPFSLPPYPLSPTPTRFDACYAGYHSLKKLETQS